MPLHIASRRGSILMVKLLINNNADINAHGEYNETPLLSALVYQQLKAAKVLLKKGAKINGEMFNGWKAIHVAVYQNDFIALQELLKYGASLDATTTDIGSTPLMI